VAEDVAGGSQGGGGDEEDSDPPAHLRLRKRERGGAEDAASHVPAEVAIEGRPCPCRRARRRLCRGGGSDGGSMRYFLFVGHDVYYSVDTWVELRRDKAGGAG
jgi:hypothetical protein